MLMKSVWRPSASVSAFILALAIGNLVLYQKPLFTYAKSASNFPQIEGWLSLASLQALQVCLLVSVLLLLSTLSIGLMKIASSILAMTNATALYFMEGYGVLLDSTMIANIFNTDARDTLGLWHISIVPHFLLLGLVPTFLIWWIRIRPSLRRKRFLASVGASAVLLASIFATTGTFIWQDKHRVALSGHVLPWSYLVNTAMHSNRTAENGNEQILLPNAHFESNVPKRKQIVVLVIGESARAENFALYGYPKETNPFTAATSMTALPIGLSCSTKTVASVACILSHEGRAASPRTQQEPLHSYLTRHGVETIFRTNNGGPPKSNVTTFERPKDILAHCKTGVCPDPNADGILNWGLAETLNSSSSNLIFLAIHYYGSHGPAYFERIPNGFEHFKPECITVKFPSCTKEELFNSYDNTIRYTDYLLADLIAQLKTVDADSAMIYVSDHGESLGEGGFYVHATPKRIAPKQQREIPFLVWMSKGFRERRGLTYANITPAETFPHDLPFHSVMGAFGMRSEIYKPEFDIFNLKN